MTVTIQEWSGAQPGKGSDPEAVERSVEPTRMS